MQHGKNKGEAGPILLAWMFAVTVPVAASCTGLPTGNGHCPGVQHVVSDTRTGEPAAVSAILVPRNLSDPSQVGNRLVFALWKDGTFVWSESPEGWGAPLRETVVEGDAVANAIAYVVKCIESVPADEREARSPDGAHICIRARDGSGWLELAADVGDVAETSDGWSSQRREGFRTHWTERDAWPSGSRSFRVAWIGCYLCFGYLGKEDAKPCEISRFTAKVLREE
jgi:hypothetical protein